MSAKNSSSKKVSGLIFGILVGLVCVMTFILLTSTTAKQEVAGISTTNHSMQNEIQTRLSCLQCAHAGKPLLCLNANDNTPFSYCASTSDATQAARGVTCAACPAAPSITPFPTGCHIEKAVCPMIACKIDSNTGKTSCPSCVAHIVCTTPQPSPVVNNDKIRITPTITPMCAPREVCRSFLGLHFCHNITSCNQY